MAVNLRRTCSPEKKEYARRLRKNMTAAEKRLWARLRNSQLGVRARRQVIMRGYIVDFYVPAWRLIIEADGSAHDDRKDYDGQRDMILARLGLKTMRFSNDEIMFRLGDVLTKIRQYGIYFSKEKAVVNTARY